MEQITLSGNSTIRIAVCNGNARTTAVEPRELTFDQFADMLSEPEVGEKDGPYYLRGGDLLKPQRGNENLKTADLLIIDGDSGFDPETGEETGAPPMNRVTAHLRKMGLKFVAHTSHSYMPGKKWKYRVAIPAKLRHEADLKACVGYIMAQLHGAGIYLTDVKENSTWAQAWYTPRVSTTEAKEAFLCEVNRDGKALNTSDCVAWWIMRDEAEAAEEQILAAEPVRPAINTLGLGPTDGESIIQRFNADHGLDWVREELSRNGYKFSHYDKRRDAYRYIRPGSETGMAGVMVFQGKHGDWCTYSHHGGADPLSHKVCDPFELFAIFQCGGDRKAAARSLMPQPKSASDWNAAPIAPIGAPISQDAEAPATVAISSPWGDPVEAIPGRQWVVRGLLIRNHISILVAPGGSGKSLLSAQLAIALAMGMAWGGWHPVEAQKVMLINAEDDGDEMRRRIHASCKIMGVNPRDLIGRLFLADDPRSIVVAKTTKEKVVAATPLADAIVKTIEEQGIGVVFVDPFAETFEGDENSNSEVKWAAAIWRGVARQCNCSVMLVHHTPKYAKGMAGDADAARGAGALVNSARIVSTLFTMTDEEAKLFLIKPEDSHKYVRFDDAKANLTLITGKAKWFEKISHELPNGDSVGVLKPWKPPGVFDGVSIDTINDILRTLDAGRDGGKYLYNVKAGPETTPAWAGSVIMEATGCDRPRAAKMIGEWLQSGLLLAAEYTSDNRRPKMGLRVDFSKKPGAE